jgi:hypothetical protein
MAEVRMTLGTKLKVTLLEATDDYIHVKTSINDGSLVWALKPITRVSSFIATGVSRFDLVSQRARPRPLHATTDIADDRKITERGTRMALRPLPQVPFNTPRALKNSRAIGRIVIETSRTGET